MHDPQRASGDIGVEPPTQPTVKTLGALDIRDWNNDNLEFISMSHSSEFGAMTFRHDVHLFSGARPELPRFLGIQFERCLCVCRLPYFDQIAVGIAYIAAKF